MTVLNATRNPQWEREELKWLDTGECWREWGYENGIVNCDCNLPDLPWIGQVARADALVGLSRRLLDIEGNPASRVVPESVGLCKWDKNETRPYFDGAMLRYAMVASGYWAENHTTELGQYKGSRQEKNLLRGAMKWDAYRRYVERWKEANISCQAVYLAVYINFLSDDPRELVARIKQCAETAKYIYEKPLYILLNHRYTFEKVKGFPVVPTGDMASWCRAVVDAGATIVHWDNKRFNDDEPDPDIQAVLREFDAA